ncbi:MAG TPA: nuclear transport factor 2 family protein [Mycobacterium sp.]|nr:nuclear transport factor 2 family protein [Mycobacterium sp.]
MTGGRITDLAALLDREKIRDCLARQARGEDRRNAELIAAACWPSATFDFGIFDGSFDEYLAWVVPGSPDVVATQHVLGQSLIELHTDTAAAETQVLAYHRIAAPDGHRDTVIGGRYLDRLDSVNGEWRIARRTMIYDWCRDLGEAVDWAGGLMGVALDADRYTGRAWGDPSEEFFGGRPRERDGAP